MKSAFFREVSEGFGSHTELHAMLLRGLSLLTGDNGVNGGMAIQFEWGSPSPWALSPKEREHRRVVWIRDAGDSTHVQLLILQEQELLMRRVVVSWSGESWIC